MKSVSAKISLTKINCNYYLFQQVLKSIIGLKHAKSFQVPSFKYNGTPDTNCDATPEATAARSDLVKSYFLNFIANRLTII